MRFAGSQFYPFPPRIARWLAAALPQMAFSIFFLLRKAGRYTTQFLDHPVRARLETPFYRGASRLAPPPFPRS